MLRLRPRRRFRSHDVTSNRMTSGSGHVTTGILGSSQDIGKSSEHSSRDWKWRHPKSGVGKSCELKWRHARDRNWRQVTGSDITASQPTSTFLWRHTCQMTSSPSWWSHPQWSCVCLAMTLWNGTCYDVAMASTAMASMSLSSGDDVLSNGNILSNEDFPSNRTGSHVTQSDIGTSTSASNRKTAVHYYCVDNVLSVSVTQKALTKRPFNPCFYIHLSNPCFGVHYHLPVWARSRQVGT